MIEAFVFFDRIFGAETFLNVNCKELTRSYLESPPAWVYHENLTRNHQSNQKTQLESRFCDLKFVEDHFLCKSKVIIDKQQYMYQNNSRLEKLL